MPEEIKGGRFTHRPETTGLHFGVIGSRIVVEPGGYQAPNVPRFYRELRIKGAYGADPVGSALENSAKLMLMYSKEREAIRGVGREPWFGLALSGGGLRSSAFSQGVLQGLHEIGCLKDLGYISSVSGGGYTAGWYTTHPSRDDELLESNSMHMQHLSQYGHYLLNGNSGSSGLDYALEILAHLSFTPVHVVANLILDLEVNLGLIRSFYREGISRSYLYKDPFESEPDLGICDSPISGLVPSSAVDKPFWIVNSTLALSDEETFQRDRLGEPFETTPLRAGSDSIGYMSVDNGSNSEWWLKVGEAIAISGAAVDSKGLKLSAPWSLLLDLANFNLGVYVEDWREKTPLDDIWYYATSPFPLYHLSDAHSRTLEAQNFYLSDGGHSENLGAYALFKRGCRVIIIADSAQDSYVNNWNESPQDQRGLAFEELRNLELMLLSDFGIRLEVPWDELFVDQGVAFIARVDGFPINLTSQGMLSADLDSNSTIRDEVAIIYLKASYEDSNPPRMTSSFINREKSEDPSFPNRSTLDVEWSEQQVASQRELGRDLVHRSAEAIVSAVRDIGSGQGARVISRN